MSSAPNVVAYWFAAQTSIREPFEVSMGKIRTAYPAKSTEVSLFGKEFAGLLAGDNNRLGSCYCMKCPSTKILDGKNTLQGFLIPNVNKTVGSLLKVLINRPGLWVGKKGSRARSGSGHQKVKSLGECSGIKRHEKGDQW